jgi:hypothetical protein
VRMLAFGGLGLLLVVGGCNDHVRVVSLEADPAGTFIFTAQTNTVMTENADGEAENIRRDWLADELNAHGMCAAGYFVEIRRLVEPPDAPSSNAHDIVYSGRCLTRRDAPAVSRN